MNETRHKGIALVEILIGTSILALVLAFVGYSLVLFLNSASLAREQTRALYLAEEGHEFLRYLRDDDWNAIDDLTIGTTYYLSISTTTVAISNTPEVIEGTYTRSFVVGALRRNGDDDFVESGGTVDAGGRVVTVEVSWGSHDVELTSILTNLYDI